MSTHHGRFAMPRTIEDAVQIIHRHLDGLSAIPAAQRGTLGFLSGFRTVRADADTLNVMARVMIITAPAAQRVQNWLEGHRPTAGVAK